MIDPGDMDDADDITVEVEDVEEWLVEQNDGYYADMADSDYDD